MEIFFLRESVGFDPMDLFCLRFKKKVSLLSRPTSCSTLQVRSGRVPVIGNAPAYSTTSPAAVTNAPVHVNASGVPLLPGGAMTVPFFSPPPTTSSSNGNDLYVHVQLGETLSIHVGNDVQHING